MCLFQHIYELSGIRPVRFLNIKTHLNKIKEISHLPNHTKHVLITPNITKNFVDKIESLLKIKAEEKERKRKIKKQRFKLMSSPKLHQSLKVDGVYQCNHIACVTSEKVWVGDGKQFILTNTNGNTLTRLNDLGGVFLNSPFVLSTEEQNCARFSYGLHTVNSESSLIYIDGIGHILSKNMKTKTLYVERTDFKWVIRCLHWSPITRDVLVGMFNTMTGKVVRYNRGWAANTNN